MSRMSDDDLHRMVAHLAKLHGVTPEHMLDEAMGEAAHHERPGARVAVAADGSEVALATTDEEWEDADEDEEEADPKEQRRGRRAGWIAAMVIMGVCIGLLAVGIIKFMNAPSEAAIKPSLNGVPPATASPVAPATELLAGLDVSFSYPGIFNQVTRVKNDPSATEQYDIGSKSNYRRLITVEVTPLENGDLTNNSSYRVRQIHPDTYKQSTEQIGGGPVVFMTNVNGQEQVMFWVHKSELLMVAATSSDPDDKVVNFIATIKGSVKWKD